MKRPGSLVGRVVKVLDGIFEGVWGCFWHGRVFVEEVGFGVSEGIVDSTAGGRYSWSYYSWSYVYNWGYACHCLVKDGLVDVMLI